jgi:hypothetical protein
MQRTPELGRSLHASGTTSDHNKVKKSLLLLLGGGGQRGKLEAVEHLVADGHRIINLLEEETVLLHAGSAWRQQHPSKHT